MNKTIATLLTAGAVLATGLAAVPAQAHGNVSCTVPRSERQPSVKLQQQLKEAGWKIQKIQVYYGCYEVYGFDENGKKVEAFFDPRTLQRIQADG
ncbi:MAG: PepSY domain-containing protein [Porphyrobacter sp.]|nr:PepSY domain-containing protein [Porphyrobacter sp.]